MAEKQFSAKTGYSLATDPAAAVDELHGMIDQPDTRTIIFFCSSRYDLAALGKELRRRYSCPVIGCTTAGEIISRGFLSHSLVGASLVGGDIRVQIRLIKFLQDFGPDDAGKHVQHLQKKKTGSGENSFLNF